MQEYTFIVVGGGIAGVSCVESIATESPNESILLLSASPIVKSVINLKQLTRNLERFDVEEKQGSTLEDENLNVTVLHQSVCHFDADLKLVGTMDGSTFKYKKLCLCTGASPKMICKNNPYVIGIRDTETVLDFEARLKDAKRIVVVGNGGIATELVFNVKCCEVVWAVKDPSITTTFLDPGASHFLLPHIMGRKKAEMDERGMGDAWGVGACQGEVGYVKRNKFVLQGGFSGGGAKSSLGCALGPDWTDIMNAKGSNTIHLTDDKSIHMEYNTEVLELLSPREVEGRSLTPFVISGHGKKEENDKDLEHTSTESEKDIQIDLHETTKTAKNTHQTTQPSTHPCTHACTHPSTQTCTQTYTWPIYVMLSGDKLIGCDFVVSATGVQPNVQPFARLCTQLKLSQSDGGIEVDSCMMTSVAGVFAAGDVCTAGWQLSPYWLQMRLWSQARQMGVQAGRSMVADLAGKLSDVHLDFCFELFAHVTQFFNFKVILLGKFNGQGLKNEYALMVKVIEGSQYIKVVLKDGRMIGAILIGETDLEETFENLILNQLDISIYGEDFLDQDIEDFFD